jgi:hypothetical protein
VSVEDLDPAALAALLPRLVDLRHDLGRYIVFEQRFAGADAELGALRAAVQSDLLRTRRGPAGDRSAWELWEELRPAALARDPDVVAIDAAIERLRDADLSGPEAALRAAAADAALVGEATTRLLRRARARLPDLE